MAVSADSILSKETKPTLKKNQDICDYKGHIKYINEVLTSYYHK